MIKDSSIDLKVDKNAMRKRGFRFLAKSAQEGKKQRLVRFEDLNVERLIEARTLEQTLDKKEAQQCPRRHGDEHKIHGARRPPATHSLRPRQLGQRPINPVSRSANQREIKGHEHDEAGEHANDLKPIA